MLRILCPMYTCIVFMFYVVILTRRSQIVVTLGGAASKILAPVHVEIILVATARNSVDPLASKPDLKCWVSSSNCN